MKTLGKIFGFIAQVLAIILVIVFLVYHINGVANFIPEQAIALFEQYKEIAAVLLISLIALAAALKTNLIITIIVALVVAALIGFMFFNFASFLKS